MLGESGRDSIIGAYAKYTNLDDKRALSCAKEKFNVYNDNAGRLLLEYILNKEEYINSAYKKLNMIAKQHNLKEVQR